jgi:hypothetical protein
MEKLWDSHLAIGIPTSILEKKLDFWGDGGSIAPMQVNAKSDWDYWKQIHAL